MTDRSIGVIAGVAVALTAQTISAIPAFPGADGAGANATGGRGGIVYHVTKINSALDDPASFDLGTIRYGLDNSKFPAGVPRTIVFDVGGVFHLGNLPQAGWDPNGNGWDARSRLTIGGTNVTLAGQTAPGAGVIFMGGGLKPQGNHNIIRNITVASGYGLTGWWKAGDPFPGVPGTAGASADPSQWFPDNVVYDGMDIAGTNLMIDHVSTLYATDETISMNEVANNVTVQYSNISQAQNYPQWDAEGGGLKGHAYGSLLEAGNSTSQAAISFHHNLYAHQKGRTPQMQKGVNGGYYDFRNNVFYNWLGTAGTKSGTTFLNLVNNFYLAGNGGDDPIGGSNPGLTTLSGGTSVISATSSIYRNGNLLDTNKDGDANDGVALSAGGAANPLWMGGLATYLGVTDSPTQAFDRVLNYVGANWWTRDGVINTPDERIINEARTGTGKIIAWADDPWNNDPAEGAEWRALKNTTPTYRTFGWDAEWDIGYGFGDGMPTWWELLHGLNPSVRDDTGDFDADGYTNLEEYLNEIAEWPAPSPIVFNGGSNRYALINNWNIIWQPSKYDTAKINSGTAIVDAVGQHAGTLLVGVDGGSSGTLHVTAGWIKVAQKLQVGSTAGSSGTLNLAGGTARVLGVTRIRENGVIQFNGGALDITGGAAIFDYTVSSPINTVRAALLSGFNNGSWNGSGINSSVVSAFNATAANSTRLAIGYAQASTISVPGDIFFGETVDGTTVLAAITFAGDTNLDFTVDSTDFTALAGHWGQSGAVWVEGDLNYDGMVNTLDFNLLAGNFGQSMTSPALAALVPEPTTAGMAIASTLLLTRRRNRR